MDHNSPDYDMMNAPMRITDAASMLRRVIDPNERPYTKTVLKYNNSLVDEWYEKVLKLICNKEGFCRSGSIYPEWEIFYTGKNLSKFINCLNEGVICRPNEKAVAHWVKIFTEYSMKNLIELGSSVVGAAWKMIIDETYIRKSLDQWELVYKHSDDPLVLRKLANNHPKLWSVDGESPFWGAEQYAEISQKVITILKTPIKPQDY
jgi:hypothetical protein